MFAVIPYFSQPELPLGPISLYGFGLLIALGFVIGGQIAMNRAKRLGLIPEHINTMIGYFVIATFLGGHLGYVLYEPAEFTDPQQYRDVMTALGTADLGRIGQALLGVKLLRVWDGLSSFGGIATSVLIAIWYMRKHNLHPWAYLDCMGHGLAFGWFLGRMGCFTANDHPGPISDFFLAQQGICQLPGVCNGPSCAVACHDMGLYEALWALGLFTLFRLLDKKPRPPGFYAAMLGLLYAPMRIFLDTFRPDTTDVRYGAFTPAQYWSLLLMLVCGAVLVFIYRRNAEPVWTAPGTEPPAEDSPPPPTEET